MVVVNRTVTICEGLSSYWDASRRPICSLAFVLPMLAVYELGLICLGPAGLRNGADIWLRELLSELGFRHFYLLPILTCAVLIGWHHLRREKWDVSGSVLYGMLVESIVLGGGLMLIAAAQNHLLSVGSSRYELRHVVAYCGAGIYEEVLFRMILVSALAAAAGWAGAGRRTSLAFAVVSASLLFAAAHYPFHCTLGDWEFGIRHGDVFSWTSFLFRATAGAFFSVLFVYRGFGIAAGAHAVYDILTTIA